MSLPLITLALVTAIALPLVAPLIALVALVALIALIALVGPDYPAVLGLGWLADDPWPAAVVAVAELTALLALSELRFQPIAGLLFAALPVAAALPLLLLLLPLPLSI